MSLNIFIDNLNSNGAPIRAIAKNFNCSINTREMSK